MSLFPDRAVAIYAKVESTPGVDAFGASPTAADQIWHRDFNPDYSGEANRSERSRASFTRTPPAGASMLQFSAGIGSELSFANSNTGGNSDPPFWHALMLAAGYAFATTTYSLDSNSTTTLTLYIYYTSGKLQKVLGWRNSFSFKARAGRKIDTEFNGQGLWVDNPLDTGEGGFYAAPAASAYSEGDPQVLKGLNIAVGSWSSDIHLAELEFSHQNEIIPREDAVAANGVQLYRIADRTTTLQLSGLNIPVNTTFNAWDQYRQSGGVLTITATFGTGTDNRMAMTYTGKANGAPDMSREFGEWVMGQTFEASNNSDDAELTFQLL